jgi:hypothetical protein
MSASLTSAIAEMLQPPRRHARKPSERARNVTWMLKKNTSKDNQEAVVDANAVAAQEDWKTRKLKVAEFFKEYLAKVNKEFEDHGKAFKKLEDDAKATKDEFNKAIKKLEDDAKATNEEFDKEIENLEDKMSRILSPYRQCQFILAFERRFMVKTFAWTSPWAGRTFKNAVCSYENLNPALINESAGIFLMSESEREHFETEFCFWFLPDYKEADPDRALVLRTARNFLTIVKQAKHGGDTNGFKVPSPAEAQLVYDALEKMGDDGKTLLNVARELEQQQLFREQRGLFCAPVPPERLRKSSTASSGSNRKSTR